MATKPLFHDGMSFGERVRSMLWVIIIIVALVAFLVGGYFWPRSNSSNARQQRQGESDYEYHQRLEAEDQEQYKDCGFRPTC
jgi:flagellar basal body-associated protein FliL